MTIYISGPMTDLPDLNLPAFEAAAKRILAAGEVPIIPQHISPPRWPMESEEGYYARCIETDLACLRMCEGIFLLPGWQASTGATIEYLMAKKMNLRVMHE